MSEPIESLDDDDGEYVVFSAEALQFLPPEWRKELQAQLDDSRSVLKTVDKELSALSKLTTSLVDMVTLKYIQGRLTAFKFSATMAAFLELDMLTTAFVVTYARLQQGGGGSGFGPDVLPAHLRPVHEAIIELRNKRFAHNTGHHSISDAMEIGFVNGHFEIKLGLQVEYRIGGAPEWPELVNFIDVMMVDRMEKIRARLEAKTGRTWETPKGPPPDMLGPAAF